jgi:hypothetical protein
MNQHAYLMSSGGRAGGCSPSIRITQLPFGNGNVNQTNYTRRKIMRDKKSPYPEFILYMTPELEKLLKAVHDAPQDSPERDRAKQALGQYVYRAYDDMIPDSSW